MRKQPPRRVALDIHGLSGHVEIFRLSGGKKNDPVVDAWLAGDPVDLRSMARTWFAHMRNCGDDVVELIHDGCPVACVKDAAFAYVNTFKNHVNVGFFYGAMLEDSAGILDGTGKRMRHVKLKPGCEIDVSALRNLILAAYADVKARLAAECASTDT